MVSDAGKIQEFWCWFQANSDRLLTIESTDAPEFAELETHVSKLGAGVYVEVGGNEKTSDKELIFTAHGVRTQFALIDEIVRNAPSVTSWKIYALKPGLFEHFSLSYEGLRISTHEIMIKHQSGRRAADSHLLVCLDSKLDDAKLLRVRKALPIVFESYFGERLFAEKVPELVLIDAPSDPQSLGFQPFVDFSTQLRGDS